MTEINRFIKGDNLSLADNVQKTSKHIIDPNNNVVRDVETWGGTIDSFDNAPEGSIGVIDIKGVMMKNNQACGPIGMTTLMSQINQAKKNPKIIGLVFEMDTPGGQVNGTFDLSKAVKDFGKPTVAFVTGTCASAGYWVASSCDTIIASNELVEFGSIGVMCTLVDDSEALAKEGYKVITIRATNSNLKNEKYYQALQGNEAPLVKELDYINKYFSKSVTTGRKNKLAEDDRILRGETFFSKEAQKLGLIDSIGTMDDAIAFIQQNKKTSKNKNTMSNTATTQRTYLNATLGITENHAETEGGSFIQSSELDAIETALATAQANTSLVATHEGTIATLQASVTEKETALATAQTSLATANEKIASLEKQITEMGSEEATPGTTPPAPNASEIEEGKTSSKYVDDGFGTRRIN